MQKKIVRKKKLRFGDSFPGQIHFPVLGEPLGVFSIITMIMLAVAVAALVLWLKS